MWEATENTSERIRLNDNARLRVCIIKDHRACRDAGSQTETAKKYMNEGKNGNDAARRSINLVVRDLMEASVAYNGKTARWCNEVRVDEVRKLRVQTRKKRPTKYNGS